MSVTRIVSGGQTGADQAGLAVGGILGIETGGWAAKGWMTEDGPAPWLAHLGLLEYPKPGYRERTFENAHDAQGTVIFGDIDSPGSRCTINACKTYCRRFLINPKPEQLREWIVRVGVDVLNVAGNRASVNPEIEQIVIDTLVAALGAK